MGKKGISVCDTHLQELYEAIEHHDDKAIVRLERELTPEEACVACTYVLKAKGNSKELLEKYLTHEGFPMHQQKPETKLQHMNYWLVRIGVYCIIFLLLFIPVLQIHSVLIKSKIFTIQYNPIELVLVVTLAALVFVKIDDLFFD